jgi:lipoyl(octanoyl) transferase
MNSLIPSTWRLIDTGCLDGYSNMAIDEALLHSFDPASSLPVLRLYGWLRPSLSLGRFQKADEVLDLEKCLDAGVPVVRRITGGGVIYHADELTYSIICAPGQIPPAASIKDSFRVLTGFLLDFYRRFGLDAGYAVDVVPVGMRLGERTDFCFAGRESFDILINGCKIGGNAQRRQKNVIFQHGSIPLSNHVETGLSYMRKRFSGCEVGVVSLADCGTASGRDCLHEEIVSAFSSSFAVKLVKDELSRDELFQFKALKNNKYATDRWNLEGVGE